MTYLEAIILGLVEGITEYLPISSTGHLLLTEHLLGLNGESIRNASQAYAIAIQGGAIACVLLLYRQRIVAMIRSLVSKDACGRKLIGQILFAFIPALVLALAFEHQIKAHLFGLRPVILAWFIGGVAILLYSKQAVGYGAGQGVGLESLSYRKSLVIGLLQCLALWPGVSRSLVTILGGLLVGLRVEAALEFSFLLGLVTLSAASGYEIIVHGDVILNHLTLPVALSGFIVAFLSAVVSVKWLVRYLAQHSLAIFGYYRIVLALLTTGLMYFGIIAE